MKVGNQYSEAFRQYELEHGIDIFKEYKKPNITEEKKKELEDWVFNLLRSRNEVPKVVWNDNLINKSLVTLSETDSYSVYKNGEFGLSSMGIDVLYHFFPEIDDVEKQGMKSINQFFYMDNKLRRVVRKALSYADSELGIYRMFLLCGAGYCVNFRPAVAKAFYEVYGIREGCKVFDSSSGYGARLLGAHFAKNVTEYLGIDPNTADSCKREIDFLSKSYDTGTKEQVLKMGSEDFTIKNFPQYENYFNLSFTSPPYFDTERYSEDETQSYKKFPTYAGWVKGFYQETINNTCDALREDGVFGINIFEKVPKIKELTKLFLANNGFYLYKIDKYLLRSLPGLITDEDGNRVKRSHEIGLNYEPIWVAKHYNQLYKDGLIDKERLNKFKERNIRGNKK